MTSRELVPAERMVDTFDRAATMSFSVVASVRGPLERVQLLASLRQLEQRHPLLLTRIVRDGDVLRFAPDSAAPIPLSELTLDEFDAAIASSIDHRVWPDNGPRAELAWARDGDRSLLLFRFHHVVSDGSSGVLAMRDLLQGLDAAPLARVPSPGQSTFFPTGHGGLRDKLRTGWMIARATFARTPRRLGDYAHPFSERRTRLQRLRLGREQSERIRVRARSVGATVHGVLCGALALSVAAHAPGAHRQRIVHPVDFRRYLRARGAEIGDAIGYYVSSVDTIHTLHDRRRLSELAAEISASVQHKKAVGEPLLTAPLAGPMFARREASLGSHRFRAFAEKRALINTFALTNLGPLETLAPSTRYGALELEDLYFVAAGSVLTTLGASASSFRGELSLQLGCVTPVIAESTAHALLARTREHLESFARE